MSEWEREEARQQVYNEDERMERENRSNWQTCKRVAERGGNRQKEGRIIFKVCYVPGRMIRA